PPCSVRFSLLSSVDAAHTERDTLSLHDALPICARTHEGTTQPTAHPRRTGRARGGELRGRHRPSSRENHRRVSRSSLRSLSHARDRKSTRLNSSHVSISYAVFCLKKKNRNSTKQ